MGDGHDANADRGVTGRDVVRSGSKMRVEVVAATSQRGLGG